MGLVITACSIRSIVAFCNRVQHLTACNLRVNPYIEDNARSAADSMRKRLIMDASSQYQNTLPVTSDELLQLLEHNGFTAELITHIPLRTVADSKQVREGFLTAEAGGGHIKNLFLRDKKKNAFLVVLPEDKDVDLKQLAGQLEAGRLSFGSADRLFEMLGVRPGAVTPLSMITGREFQVKLIMDSALKNCKVLYMHPLVNDRTVAMDPAALEAFLASLDVHIEWLEIE